MTLTALRRVVMAANGLAILAAGAAAWFSLRAEPAAARDWPKIFPAKRTDAGTNEVTGPGPKDEYTASLSWPQGPKPVPVDDTPKAPPPPVDLFKSKYKLNGVFLGRPDLAPSFAQLTAEGVDRPFSVKVGERIQQDPTALQVDPVLTPWLLVDVREWDGRGPKSPCAADFLNIQTGDKQTLEMIAGNVVSLDNPPSKDIPPFGSVDPSGKPPRGQQIRAKPVRLDPANGVLEWNIEDAEVDYLDAWGDDQAREISAVTSKDAEGRPDGFILKAVKPGSRAEAYGFKPEDKIISVNGEKVVSTENAVATGKKQYEGGAKTFQVKALRAGKEMNFTFHAPEKKKGKAKS
jgi:hypothetical protein